MASWMHWTLHTDTDQVAWLKLDRGDRSANSINHQVLQELDEALKQIADQKPVACVIASGKASGFIAGADVHQFKTFATPEEAEVFIRLGQDVFSRLEALSVPTIAFIQGFCMGGGLELALACRYRIAVDDERTRLGLPEVKLGIHPGWGGSVRLPRLIGAPQALDLMLTGRALRAKAAQRMGLVDAAPPQRLALKVVQHFATTTPKNRSLSWWLKATNAGWCRPVLGMWVARSLRSKARRDHYPAPHALLQQWIDHGVGEGAYAHERESITRMAMTPTSRSLVHVFELHEQMKKAAPSGPIEGQRVHVIGAGVMGGDIAAWCAARGFEVTLQDLKPELIAQAYQRAHKLAQKKLKAPHHVMAMMDRLLPDPEGHGLARADVVIEAVSERLDIKHKVFKRVLAEAKPDAIIATNTSTIPLEDLAQMGVPLERLVGIHFFNPVAKMPLVEVVRTPHTPQALLDRTLSFVRAIDKLPLVVQSAPGFLVNRVLLPYMMEATLMLEEGCSGPIIDAAARAFGMPMGPIELADTVGLDVCVAALSSLGEHTQEAVPEILKAAVAAGNLGVKTGQGFYTYKKGKRTDASVVPDQLPEDITHRLILRLVNEGMACLRRGVVSDEAALDAGSVFGFGFPPFRGGLMRYIHDTGPELLLQRMEKLAQQYGPRFTPDAAWQTVLRTEDEVCGSL